jgi:putative ABC transport system permease protein
VLRIALRGLLARKLRTVLTGFAVVLGVAFVAGTFVFTDTIDASFKDLFERAHKGEDVSIEAKQAVKADFSVPATMPAATLDRVKALPGVKVAEGTVSSDGALLDDNGKPIVSNGPPTLILSASTEKTFQALEYPQGGPPQTAGQVAIDRGTANKYHWKPGSRVTVAGRAPKTTYTVSGIATLGGSDSLGGSRMVILTLPEAQRVTGHKGYDGISVAADSGTTPEALKATVVGELGAKSFEVRTGKEAAEQQAQDLSSALGFIRTALLVFAGVALLVGGFLIFNTFQVTVAQRQKEFALMRTLGASRRQVLASVVAETLVIGLIASVLGVLGGLLLAPALRGLLQSFGLDLGSTSIIVEPRTVIVGLIVGMVATVISGIVPARRATRVDPIEAMRDGVAPGGGRLPRRRIVAATVVEGLGVAVLLTALFASPGTAATTAGILGFGVVLMMFGMALLAPVLVRPLSSVVGRPLQRIQGLTGRLARENAVRQPQRTAVTASALMIGLALVVFVTIFAAGLKATIDKGIDDQVLAAGIVTHTDGFSPLPSAAAETLRATDGVSIVSTVRFASGKVRGVAGTQSASGVDPATAPKAIKLKIDAGPADALARLGTNGAIVGKDFAESNHLGPGKTLHVTTPTGAERDYRVLATYDAGVGVISGIVLPAQSLERHWNAKDIAFALVGADAGVTPGALRDREKAALAGFPTAKPWTIDEFKAEQRKQVDSLLGLIYALLSLSVIVALLGIVNTLALSVHERTRELGMLRAVGMSRRQVRRMIRAEAVITAAIGAVLGLALGVAFAAIVSRPLAKEGFAFAVPVGALAVLLVVAALAGVLAAIPPARRASRVDVLRAVTTE